jgi:hypothetical protein
MTDQAPAPIVVFAVTPMFELAGRAAMSLSTRPRWKFAVHDGDRRRFGDRTPRPALDLKIVSRKENQQ